MLSEKEIHLHAKKDIMKDDRKNPDVAEQLKSCNQRLVEVIDGADWENAERLMDERNCLLEEIATTLNSNSSAVSEEKQLSKKRQLRWLLEDIQISNERFIEDIKGRIVIHRDKMRKLKKGRTALGLYKSSKRDNPRFLNRFG